MAVKSKGNPTKPVNCIFVDSNPKRDRRYRLGSRQNPVNSIGDALEIIGKHASERKATLP